MLERSCRENTWWNISDAILHDWLEIVWTVSSTNAKCFMPSCSIRSIWSRKSHCKIWSYWIIHVFHQAWFLFFHTFLKEYLFVELDPEVFSKTIKVLEKLASQKIPVVMVSLHKRNQFLSNVVGALARLLLPINVPVLQQSFAWNTRNCLSLTKKISIISS